MDPLPWPQTILACLLTIAVHGADWPSWRGLHSDGIAHNEKIRRNWQQQPPSLLWSARVGRGFSCPSVKGERVITLGEHEQKEAVHCHDGSGTLLWRTILNSGKPDPGGYRGPCSTVAIAADTVFVIGWPASVFCLDLVTGAIIWSKDLVKEHAAQLHRNGYCSSPLIIDDRVILPIKHNNYSLLCLAANTGSTLWTAGQANLRTVWASPIQTASGIIHLDGPRLVCINPHTGKETWRSPESAGRFEATGATPIISDKHILFASKYGKSTAEQICLDAKTQQRLWSSTQFLTWFQTGVRFENMVIAVHQEGNAKGAQPLKAINLQDGTILWSIAELSVGNISARIQGTAAITGLPDQQILLHSESKLWLIDTAPSGAKAVGVIQNISPRRWAVMPVVAHRRIYLRGTDTMYCLDAR